MSEERRKILDMLAAGKLSVDDAERLLKAVDKGGEAAKPTEEKSFRTEMGKAKPRYLIVQVDSDRGNGKKDGKVNVRVPLQLLRAGVKLASLVPVQAREKVQESLQQKGIALDWDNLKPENLESLIDAMGEMTVDINDEHDKVRVFCE